MYHSEEIITSQKPLEKIDEGFVPPKQPVKPPSTPQPIKQEKEQK